MFCVYRCIGLAAIQARGEVPASIGSPAARRQALERAMSTVKGREAAWVEGWFYNRDVATIKREEVGRWLAGTVFAAEMSEIESDPSLLNELNGMIETGT